MNKQNKAKTAKPKRWEPFLSYMAGYYFPSVRSSREASRTKRGKPSSIRSLAWLRSKRLAFVSNLSGLDAEPVVIQSEALPCWSAGQIKFDDLENVKRWAVAIKVRSIAATMDGVSFPPINVVYVFGSSSSRSLAWIRSVKHCRRWGNEIVDLSGALSIGGGWVEKMGKSREDQRFD